MEPTLIIITVILACTFIIGCILINKSHIPTFLNNSLPNYKDIEPAYQIYNNNYIKEILENTEKYPDILTKEEKEKYNYKQLFSNLKEFNYYLCSELLMNLPNEKINPGLLNPLILNSKFTNIKLKITLIVPGYKLNYTINEIKYIIYIDSKLDYNLLSITIYINKNESEEKLNKEYDNLLQFIIDKYNNYLSIVNDPRLKAEAYQNQKF